MTLAITANTILNRPSVEVLMMTMYIQEDIFKVVHLACVSLL